MMRRSDRDQFDRLLESVLAALPAKLRELLEQTPLIVEDAPDEKLLRELGMEQEPDGLCGLHTGVPLTERSVNDGWDNPEMIHLFRIGIIEQAGGWEEGHEAVEEEIRITLLHEIGHHYGLEESDLEELGYD